MRVLVMMFFSPVEIYNYNKAGNEHQLHNIYGYDHLISKKEVHVDCIFPKISNEFLVGYPLLRRIFYEFKLYQLQFKCARMSSKYDVIYSPHDFHLIFLSFLRFIKVCKSPVLSISHFAFNSSLIEKRLTRVYRSIEKFFYFRGIDKILFLNDNVLKMARNYSILPKRHQDYLNWGANFDFFDSFKLDDNFKNNSSYLISIGSANRDYNTLIQSMKTINFKLIIFANHNISMNLSKNLPSNVILDNSVKQSIKSVALLRKHYYNSIAVLLPLKDKTDISSGASVIVEAMAMGKPIIITDFPINYIDVEKEGVGIKVSLNNPEGWKKAIEFLIQNPIERKKMGERAKYLAKHKYNYSLFCNKLLLNLKTLSDENSTN